MVNVQSEAAHGESSNSWLAAIIKSDQNNRTLFYGLLIIFLITVILRLPSLYTVFLDIDEAQNGYFAWSVLNGKLPYKEIVGDKPFFHFYFFEMSFAIFGSQSYEGLHLVLLFWVLAQVFLIYKIGSLMSKRGVGLLAALFYTFMTTVDQPKIIAASAELIMNLPHILCIYLFLCYWKKRDSGTVSYLYLISSGLLAGITFNTSLKGGIVLLPIAGIMLIFFVLLDSNNKVKAFFIELGRGCLFMLAFLTPFSLCLLYFYHIGVAGDYLFWVFLYNFRYLSAGTETIPITLGVLKTLMWIGFRLVQSLFAYYTIKRFVSKDYWRKLKSNSLSSEEKLIIFSIIWFIGSYIAVASGKRFYGHYLLQALPALSVLAAISSYYFIEKLIGKMEKKLRIKRRLFILAVVLPPLLFLVPKIDQKTLFYQILNVEFPDYPAIGNYIKERTKSTDSIYVWGFATQIYYYADRKVAGRYSWSDFFVGRIPGSPVNNDPNFDTNRFAFRKVRGHFFEDMGKYKPAYFVDTAAAKIHDYGKYPIQQYPDLMKWLNKHYQFETTVKGVALYKRK